MKRHILSRYLITQFLIRTFLITLALTGVLLVFDLLGNIIAITAHHDDAIATVFQYLSLRFFQIFILSLPMGVLLASMTTFFRLIHSQEVTAIFAAGVPIYHIALILSLAALAPVFLHFFLSNTIVPHTSFRLQVWAKDEFKGEPPVAGLPLMPAWFEVSSDIIRADKASPDGSMLEDVVLIRKDSLGIMKQYFEADKAYYKNNGWRLDRVTETNLQNKKTTMEDRVFLDLALTPEDILLAGRSDSSMSIFDFYRFASDPRMTPQAQLLYKVWFQRNMAAPLESLIMVLLAAPLGFQQARRNSMLLNCFLVIAAGFSYFLVERLFLSFAETGILPAILAIWSPPVIFGMIGWWILIYKQE